MLECKKRLGYRSVLTCTLFFMLMTCYGCATLDKNECINADWISIGLEDGAKGRKASYIGKHRKACAQHGVSPDFALYERGRQQGLEEYCTPRNGYYQGNAGRHYNGVCPVHLEAAYLRALNQGRDVYNYAQQVEHQQRDLKKQYQLLDAIEQDIAGSEDELVKPGVSPKRRRQLLAEIRLLEDDQKSMLNDIAEAEHALEDMQAYLRKLRAQNPYP